MSFTNFPHGVSSFGSPVGGSGMLPVMGGRIASTGDAKVYFVDPANGSDGNTGLSPDKALDTVSAAYDKTVDKAGDVIYLLNDGNTSGTSRESVTLVWSNDNTHLIGLCAPVMLSQRSRISTPSGTTTIVTPMLTVSGNGNIFANISLFEGVSENGQESVGINLSGERNYFHNVAVMNMAHENSADEAGSSNVLMNGGSENVFDSCFFGVDTVARSAANANIEFQNSASRNVFRDCFFNMFADANTPVFVEASSAADVDRFTLFERCKFINVDNITAVTTITQAFNVIGSGGGGDLGGAILVFDCMFNGCTDITAADNSAVKILGHTTEGDPGIRASMLATATDLN